MTVDDLETIRNLLLASTSNSLDPVVRRMWGEIRKDMVLELDDEIDRQKQ